MITTTCLIENYIFLLNCTDHTLCECTRDFVVRYNVTIKHQDDDDDDDELSIVHFSFILKKSINNNQSILVSLIISDLKKKLIFSFE